MNDLTFIFDMQRANQKYPNYNWADVWSKGQLESKYWLIETVNNLFVQRHIGTIFVLAGWVGSLSAIIFKEAQFSFDKIRSFDIDPECAAIAETINRTQVMDNWKFKASTLDIRTLTYNGDHYTSIKSNGDIVELYDNPSVIINTSCEHIEGFESWWNSIPSGKLCVLQNNNFRHIPEHINCVDSEKEFQLLAPMSDVLYSGTLPLEQYQRYMLIGYK